MAITSLISFNLSTTTVKIITLLHLLLLLPTFYCLNHYPPPLKDTNQGLLVEEKTRLGSTPPSCYNKCNKCHPCMAVQVPTLPSPGREQPAAAAAPSLNRAKPIDYFDLSSSSAAAALSSPSLGEGNRYSNYKPLGWKCRCNGHFYNP